MPVAPFHVGLLGVGAGGCIVMVSRLTGDRTSSDGGNARLGMRCAHEGRIARRQAHPKSSDHPWFDLEATTPNSPAASARCDSIAMARMDSTHSPPPSAFRHAPGRTTKQA